MMNRRAQKRMFQKRVIIFVITALFIISAILIGSSVSGLAKTSASEEASYKYYTSITVEQGDTLWSIASEHMSSEYDEIEDYIMEVCNLNHLYNDGISAGECLTIPYYASETL